MFRKLALALATGFPKVRNIFNPPWPHRLFMCHFAQLAHWIIRWLLPMGSPLEFPGPLEVTDK
jgi:hypothetical protein